MRKKVFSSLSAPMRSAFVNSVPNSHKPLSVGLSIAVIASSLALSAIQADPASAAVNMPNPGVAGSNTTVNFNGEPIREGSTLAGGSVIGIGTSALLNPGVGVREIRTSYDANVVYQAGTARAPEGWTLMYSTDGGHTWSDTEPDPASDVTDIKASASNVAAGLISGFSQTYSTETTASIPSSTFSASTGGDGWGVAFMDDYIFNVYHHGYETRLDCHLRSTGVRCLEGTNLYPALISTEFDGNPVNFYSSSRSDVVPEVINGKLYTLTSPTSGPDFDRPGILCVNVIASPSYCGFTPLSTKTVSPSAVTWSAGLTEPIRVGSRIFGVNTDGATGSELLCFDLSVNGICTDSPVHLVDPGDVSTSSARIEKIGDNVYTIAGLQLSCHAAADLQLCSGNWPQALDLNTYQTAMMAVHTNASGAPDGICTYYNCFNLNGESRTDWVNPYSLYGWQIIDVWFKGVTTLGKHYFGDGSQIYCFDYATESACEGFSSGQFGYLYQIAVDPENPACLWTDEDAGRIVNMDALTGDLGCAANPVITLQPSQFAPRYACSTLNGIDRWNTLRLSNLVGGGSAEAIKLTVRDAAGNPVSGFTNLPISLDQDLDMRSMNVLLSGSRPTFSFAFTGVTGTISSATIALEYMGKGPELCSTAVLNSPGTFTPATIQSYSNDFVGTTNSYQSQRNFNIGASTVNDNLFLTVPSAPRNLVGSGLNTSATLTFAPPTDNGGLDLGDYEYSLDGGNTFSAISNLLDNGNGTYSVALSGLTAGQTYAIRVAATNALGRGALASLNLTVQIVDFGNIPDTYQNAGPIYLATQNGAGLPYTYLASPSNICTVSSNIVTLLAAGVCHLTQNQAGDATHIATTANSHFNVLPNPVVIQVPDAPINLVARPASTQVSLAWDAPASDGGGPITDYVIYYKVGSSWVPLVDGTSTNTSAIVTGLTNGSTYSFKVAAVNSAGQGAFCASIDAVPATVPNSPTDLAATSGSSANLTWTAPTDDGGSTIIDYVIQFKLTSDASWTDFVDGVSDATGATVTDLDPAETYDFQVFAVNAIGNGAAVSTVTLNAVGQAEALSLSWAANNDGVTIINHIVEYRVQGDTSWLQVDTFSTERSAILSGLTNGTPYEIRVARIANQGSGPVVSSYTSAVLGTPVAAPNAPTITATAGAAQVSLSWTLPSGNGADILDYVIQYRVVGQASWITWVDGVSTLRTSVVIGLVNGTTYEFQVAAENSVGTGLYSGIATAKPRTTPGPTSGLEVTATGTTLIATWFAPTDDGGASISDYQIEYKTLSAITWTVFAHTASTNLSATITGQAAETTYSVRVAAKNVAGVGAFGPASSAITEAGANQNFQQRSNQSSSNAKPVITKSPKQVIRHNQSEIVKFKFDSISDVSTIMVDGFEMKFKLDGGTLTFTDPGLDLGDKDVLVMGSWGTLTLSQAVEVVPNANGSLRVTGFAPGQSQMNAKMRQTIRAFFSTLDTPTSITCKGSTSGPTILKVDPSLAKARAAAVCGFIKSLGIVTIYKMSHVNTTLMSPTARNVKLTLG